MDNLPAFSSVAENESEQSFTQRRFGFDFKSARHIGTIIGEGSDDDVREIENPHLFARIVRPVPVEHGLPAFVPGAVRLECEALRPFITFHEAHNISPVPGFFLCREDLLDFAMDGWIPARVISA